MNSLPTEENLLNIIEMRQLSTKPLCYDVFCNGTYMGLLHYSWTYGGLDKAWLLEMDGQQYQFGSVRQAKRYLERYPV